MAFQVSRTRLSIMAVLSNAVVWIVSTRQPICKSSRPFNNPLVTMPNAPITIGTIVTFMFHNFLNSFESFSHQRLLMVFQLTWSESKSPQVSWTVLSILADLNNIVVWMVFTWPLISKSSSPCTNSLLTVLSVPVTFVITTTFIFHIFQFSSKVK